MCAGEGGGLGGAGHPQRRRGAVLVGQGGSDGVCSGTACPDSMALRSLATPRPRGFGGKGGGTLTRRQRVCPAGEHWLGAAEAGGWLIRFPPLPVLAWEWQRSGWVCEPERTRPCPCTAPPLGAAPGLAVAAPEWVQWLSPWGGPPGLGAWSSATWLLFGASASWVLGSFWFSA